MGIIPSESAELLKALTRIAEALESLSRVGLHLSSVMQDFDSAKVDELARLATAAEKLTSSKGGRRA